MHDTNSTNRSIKLRIRRSAEKITRWEIPVSERTRAQVEIFATQEGLSVGVAAEKLLLLGIAAHLSVKEGQKTEPEFTDRQPCPHAIQQVPENSVTEPPPEEYTHAWNIRGSSKKLLS